MDNENEEIRDLHNAFGENQRESMDPGLNGFNSQNFLDLHNGQISRESMNPIFNPFQPNNSSQDLTNQNQNILDKEKEDENQNEETSNNKDIGMPVYISDGKTEPFCLNEVAANHARDVYNQPRTPEEEATIRTADAALEELYGRLESGTPAKKM